MLSPRYKQCFLLRILLIATATTYSLENFAAAWIPIQKCSTYRKKLIPFHPLPDTHFRDRTTSTSPLKMIFNDETSQLIASASVLLEDPLSEKYIELIDPPMKILPSRETTELVLIKPAMAGVDLNSPYVQSEFLDNLSHFFGDLLVLLAPSTAFVRLFVALGRFFGLASEYVDDNTISFDDALIDSTLLVVAILLFAKSVTPILQASFEVLDERDEYAYCQLFEPVGISEIQHKTMKRACIDWVEDLEPGTVVVGDSYTTGGNIDGDDHDCVYWLYEGSVTVSFKGVPIKDITSDPDNGQCSLDAVCIDEYCALGLLADMRFLYNIDHMDRSTTASSVSNSDTTELRYPTTTIGPEGATLMRIKGKNLFSVMENDEKLGLAIRELLVTSLKRDVEFLLNSSSRGVLLQDATAQEKMAPLPKRRRVTDCPIYETFYDGSF